jgi:CRP/FNR family transcriptional regulator, cyclic AMP receptor protein
MGSFMNASYGLNSRDRCLTCAVREEGLFCNPSIHALNRFKEITTTITFSKGAMLFTEGQHPTGVFVLCAGRAKLFTSSRNGKTIITKIAEQGDVLGLNAVVSNRPCEVTAQMMGPGQANFIPRNSLLQLLNDDSEVALHVAAELSRNYYAAHEEIRTLGLVSMAERLAKCLLAWSGKTVPGEDSTQLKLALTHEEIAESIGTSREVVSRLLCEFRQKQLIQLKGTTLMIRNRGLEEITHGDSALAEERCRT